MRLKSITHFLLITGYTAALLWVSLSYLFAGYATFSLGQPFPVETLSGQAVDTVIGIVICKTVSNIFEHNDGGIFGQSWEVEIYANQLETEIIE